jgi:hypothetical protein
MRKLTMLPAVFATVCFALAGIASPASAWDVTFTRDKDGNRTSNSFNLMVVLEQQTNNPNNSTETKGECFIRFNGSDCTIEDFPSSTNALVTVYASTSPSVNARNVYGKIQFWIGVFQDSEVHIPTGVVSFKTDKTWAELVALGGSNAVNVAILPQSAVEAGETYSSRPNSGTSYFGQTFGNCGSKDLAYDQGGASVCKIDFLAGCYSPVFARPGGGASPKAKIWVNKTDDGPSDHVLCVNDDQEVDYEIKVQ